MTCHIRNSRILFVIPLAILAALLLTAPAHAQDVQPPTPETTPAPPQDIEVILPTDPQSQSLTEPLTTDPAPIVETTPTETMPADTAQAEDTPTVPVPDEPSATQGISDTGSIVQDATVAVVPVVSDPVVEISTSGDPYYTYLGITHYFLPTGGTCPTITPTVTCVISGANTPIKDAIADAISKVASGSVGIYVQGGDPYVEDVIINSSRINALTGKLVSGNFPLINGNVTISNLTIPFSLSGFTINSGVTFNNNTSTITLTDLDVQNASGDGISVTNQKGAVVMNRVESSNNLGNGASIDTSSGTTAATVTITNSAFDDNNAGDSADCGTFCGGLQVKTNNAAVTLNGVSASRNHGHGVSILQPGNVTIKNSIFNNNEASASTNYDGIYLDYLSTGGGLTLTNSLADNNSGGGLNIRGGSPSSYIPGSVTLNYFETNGNLHGSGINFVCRGNITLGNVTSSDNSAYGVWMQNNQYIRTVSVINSVFNSNGVDGLYIVTSGNVTLTHIDANDNTGSGSAGADEGVFINTLTGTGAYGSVTISALGSDTNEFNHNSGYGLYIKSNGTISLSNINAMDDGNYGAWMQNNINGYVRTVSVKNGIFNSNKNDGLYIESFGNVTLTHIEANNNTGNGTKIYTLANTVLGIGNVTINALGSDRNEFNQNSDSGIMIYDYATIFL